MTLTASVQMPHMLQDRHCRLPRHRRGRAARRRSRCRRRLRPENVARPGIRPPRLGGPEISPRARLDRGPAREPDRLLPQPRPAPRGPRRLRRRGPPARARSRHRLQCRRLFLLPRHLRGRAADGDGRVSRPLRHQRIQGALARHRHQHLPDGALSRRLAARDHLFAGAADGLRRRAARHRPRRHPPAQSRRDLPLQDRHRPHL